MGFEPTTFVIIDLPFKVVLLSLEVGLTSSETLADRYVYPYTVRAIHTAKQDYTAKVKVLKKMGWRRVAFIYEESTSFVEVRLVRFTRRPLAFDVTSSNSDPKKDQ